eukprot:jgi/Mesvir1/16221/Mv08475-RA.1
MEESGPSINSTDREERILARRARIAACIAAKKAGDEGSKNKVDTEEKQIGKGKAQVLESKKRLARTKALGDDTVTSVRVLGDDRENTRRIEEEQRRQDMRAKLLGEAEHSSKQNAQVAMKWADLFSIEVPQDLFEEIEAQRRACERITESKDRLIADIKAELKLKDDEYVKALKRQAEDVDALLGHMGKQFRELQASYAEELEEIEAAFLQERTELLESNNTEIKALFDKRQQMEQAFMDMMQRKAEEYQQQLNKLRQQDAEDYNILKIRLETDIQNLEQHLETMRATYQLNTEKLEYNYRVLVERDLENQSTINQQKRKISRQRDILSGLKAKYAEMDKKCQEENNKLTEEYKRVTEQFKDLQGKYKHFEQNDIERYRQIWEMNEAEVAKLVRKVLEADKVIHEQQLGLAWHPPDEEFFKTPMAPPHAGAEHEHEATTEGEGGKEGGSNTVGGGEGGSSQGGDASEGDGEKRPGRSKEGEDDEDEERNAAADEEALRRQLEEKLLEPKYDAMKTLLCNEAGFLLDAKAKRQLAIAPHDMARKTKVDAIMRALGVHDPPALDRLYGFLTEVKVFGSAGGASTEQETILVHPDHAAAQLKLFVESEQRAAAGANGAGVGAGVSSKTARLAAAHAQDKAEVKRKLERDREYWQRMANVISPKVFRVWGALERALAKYSRTLAERQNLLLSTQQLQQQNLELRALLNQFLASKVWGLLELFPCDAAQQKGQACGTQATQRPCLPASAGSFLRHSAV